MRGESWDSFRVPFVFADEFVHHLSRYPILESDIRGVKPVFERFQRIWCEVENVLRAHPSFNLPDLDFPGSIDSARRWNVLRQQQINWPRGNGGASPDVRRVESNLAQAADQLKLIFVLHALAHGWEVCGRILEGDQLFSLPLSLIEAKDFRFSADWSFAFYRTLKFNDLKFLVRLEEDRRIVRIAPPPVLSKRRLQSVLKELNVPNRDDERRASAFFMGIDVDFSPFPRRIEYDFIHRFYQHRQSTFKHPRGPRSDEKWAVEALWELRESLQKAEKTKKAVAKKISSHLSQKRIHRGEITIIRYLDAADLWRKIPGWSETR
ncbi:MAG: hypothetical protein JJ919_13025 [Henriciella sp.]|nr:hypothetical protein [Henriciella sp.]